MEMSAKTTTTTEELLERITKDFVRAEQRTITTYRDVAREYSLTTDFAKRLLFTIFKKQKSVSIEATEETNDNTNTNNTIKAIYEIDGFSANECGNKSSVRRVSLCIGCERFERECEFEFDMDRSKASVYALAKTYKACASEEDENEAIVEKLVQFEEECTKTLQEKDEQLALGNGMIETAEYAKKLPKGKKFVTPQNNPMIVPMKKEVAATVETKKVETKKPGGTVDKKGPKSGNIASMFGGTGKTTTTAKAAVKKKPAPPPPKKKTPEKIIKAPTPKKNTVAMNADAMIEDDEESDSEELGGGRRNKAKRGHFVDEDEDEEPATTPLKKAKTTEEDSEPPSPEIIDKVEEEEEEEEEDTPRRRSTRSTPSKGTTPSTNSKKEKPLSKKAQKDIIKARKSRMEKRVIEEMDDETGEESMRTVFIDPETNEECNEDGSLKAK